MLEEVLARLDNQDLLIQVLKHEIEKLKSNIDPHWDWVGMKELNAKKFSRQLADSMRQSNDWIEGIHWRRNGNKFEYNLVTIMHLYNNGSLNHTNWLRSQKPYLTILKESQK